MGNDFSSLYLGRFSRPTEVKDPNAPCPATGGKSSHSLVQKNDSQSECRNCHGVYIHKDDQK